MPYKFCILVFSIKLVNIQKKVNLKFIIYLLK
jgi:hypothetical protein